MMSNKFFVFTRYRIVLFSGLLIVLTLFAIFGESIRLAMFAEGDAFRHFDGNLSVHFIDVGHGDAIAIKFPDNRTMLIDGGAEFYSRRVQNYVKQRISKNRIDYVVNTHPSDDHSGGLVGVLSEFKIGTVYRPVARVVGDPDQESTRVATLNPLPSYNNFIGQAYKHAERVDIIKAGIRIEGKDWKLQFHTPSEDVMHAGLGGDVRQLSPIITLEYGNSIFVLTGSAGFVAEGDFVTSDSAREIFQTERIADKKIYLKVGDSGSNNATGLPFLSLVRPTTAIISVGTRLQGYPDSRVMNELRYRQNVEKIHLTRDDGNIAIRTNGTSAKTFLGFNNPPNLWWLYIALCATSFSLSFWNYKRATATEA